MPAARLADWLGLPHGTPSHDTLGRVFDRLDPGQFKAGFLRWVQGTLTPQTDPAMANAAPVARGFHP